MNRHFNLVINFIALNVPQPDIFPFLLTLEEPIIVEVIRLMEESGEFLYWSFNMGLLS